MSNLLRLNKAFDRIGSATDLDNLIKNAIVALRIDLGFDRAGFLLHDPETQHQVGTWGTDAQGALRDEHEFSAPVTEEQITSPDEERIVLKERMTLVEMEEVIGIGWHVQAAIFADRELVGWLYIDNLVNQKPISPEEFELIKTFANVYGQLIARATVENQLNIAKESVANQKDATVQAMNLVKQLEARLTGNEKMVALAEQLTGLIPISSRSVGNLLNFMSLLTPDQFNETDRPLMASARMSANRLARIFRYFDQKIHEATDNNTQTMSTRMVREYWLKQFSGYFIDTPHILNIDVDSDTEEVRLPLILMTLMVKELVSNALSHGLEDAPPGEVNISLNVNTDSIHLTVEDSGQGLDESNYVDALKLFVTSKPNELLGSGLNVTQNYVERWLNGQLALDESPLGGLRCTLTIPTAQ